MPNSAVYISHNEDFNINSNNPHLMQHQPAVTSPTTPPCQSHSSSVSGDGGGASNNAGEQSTYPAEAIPQSVKGAPEHLRGVIRKRQNSESARRSRQRRKVAAKAFYERFDNQCKRLKALEDKVAQLAELVRRKRQQERQQEAEAADADPQGIREDTVAAASLVTNDNSNTNDNNNENTNLITSGNASAMQVDNSTNTNSNNKSSNNDNSNNNNTPNNVENIVHSSNAPHEPTSTIEIRGVGSTGSTSQVNQFYNSSNQQQQQDYGTPSAVTSAVSALPNTSVHNSHQYVQNSTSTKQEASGMVESTHGPAPYEARHTHPIPHHVPQHPAQHNHQTASSISAMASNVRTHSNQHSASDATTRSNHSARGYTSTSRYATPAGMTHVDGNMVHPGLANGSTSVGVSTMSIPSCRTLEHGVDRMGITGDSGESQHDSILMANSGAHSNSIVNGTPSMATPSPMIRTDQVVQGMNVSTDNMTLPAENSHGFGFDNDIEFDPAAAMNTQHLYSPC